MYSRFTRITFIAALISLHSSSGYAVADLCEPEIKEAIPREITVGFPGKQVSVVGHQHPNRGEEGVEVFLLQLFDHPDQFISEKNNYASLKKKLDSLLKSNGSALRHWKQDLEILRQLLIGKQISNIFIECSPDLFQVFEVESNRLYENGKKILTKMGYGSSEEKEILVMALTPGFYLKNAEPEIFGNATMNTAEPSDEEISSYDKAFCPKKKEDEGSAISKEKIVALENLFRSLRERGFKGQIEAMFANASIEVSSLLKNEIEKKSVDSVDMVKAFQKSFGIDLNDFELEQVTVFFQTSENLIRSIDEYNEKIIANLTDAIRSYDQCWGRDALIAKNLAKKPGNSILFIGIRHLAAQASLLRRECKNESNYSGEFHD